MIAPDSTLRRRIERGDLMRQTIDRLLGQPIAAADALLASLVCGWHGFDLALSAAFIARLRSVHSQSANDPVSFQLSGSWIRQARLARDHAPPLSGAHNPPRPCMGLAGFLLVLFAILFWRLFIVSTEGVAETAAAS